MCELVARCNKCVFTASVSQQYYVRYPGISLGASLLLFRREPLKVGLSVSLKNVTHASCVLR